MGLRRRLAASCSGVVLSSITALHCGGQDTTNVTGDAHDVDPTTSATEPEGPGRGPREQQPERGERPEMPDRSCEPRAAGGPYWLTERETVEIELECRNGAELPRTLQVTNLPAHATFDAQSGRIVFTPELDQAGVYDLELRMAGSDERGHVEVQVADAFEAPENVPPDPALYTEEFGLPVVHLGVDPDINDDEYTPATITYRGHTFQDAQAKYRGQTSLKYPKKSFTLEFAKADRFGDPLVIPGFSRKRKVTLTTTFDDNSYLRARLAFELWNRSGADQVRVETYSVVVYLDGAYHGVYTLTDKVNGNLMEDYGLFEDGNLYKARTHDANFRLTRANDPARLKASLSAGYTKEEGTPAPDEPGANADLEALVSWVATSPPQVFVAELDSQLVRRDYEAWWMLVTVIDALDSAGKNSYHYRDPRPGADGRFRMVPWDFNESFGQNWATIRQLATRDAEAVNALNGLFERLHAEPETRAPLLERLRSALEGEWELQSVLDTLDTWAEELHHAALRDERRWADEYRAFFNGREDYTSHEQELAYVRQWLVDRYAYISDHFWQVGPEQPAAGPSGASGAGSPDGDERAASDDDPDAGSPDADDAGAGR